MTHPTKLRQLRDADRTRLRKLRRAGTAVKGAP